MIARVCNHSDKKKHGKDRKGNQRFRCKACGATLIEETKKPLGDMRIDLDRAAMALGLLLEGMSIRSVERLTNLNRDTICRLILTVGENCRRFLAETVKGVEVEDVQIDEIWSFVGCKQKTCKKRGYDDERGDSWTFVGVERNTKMVLAHHVGRRDNEDTQAFLDKLRSATAGHFQISSDGLPAYRHAVPFTFRHDVDFGMLVKNYANSQDETRYSPAQITSAEKQSVWGSPDESRICTSHIERLNLTIRMQIRRFTRLTNAHSKSLEHHTAMQNIFFAWYNFCKKHSSIKQTPAMASGLAGKPWTIRELVEAAAQS